MSGMVLCCVFIAHFKPMKFLIAYRIYIATNGNTEEICVSGTFNAKTPCQFCLEEFKL